MKHTLLVLSLFGGLALVINGCSGDNGSGKLADPKPSESESQPSQPTSDTSPTEPVRTPTPVTVPDAGPTSSVPTKACGSTATAVECAQCCLSEHNPLAGCACNAGAQCQAACGTNFCNGDPPSIPCGICLFQAKCQIGDTSNLQADVRTCMQQSACSSKPGPNVQQH